MENTILPHLHTVIITLILIQQAKNVFFLPITNCNNITRIFRSHIQNGFNYSNILIHSRKDNQIPPLAWILRLTPTQIQQKLKWVNNEAKYKQFDMHLMNASAWDDYRIIYLPSGWDYQAIDIDKKRWLHKHYKLNYMEYTALITSYMFRMQSYIKESVNNIVVNSLINTKWNPLNTVSMTIRWGDKCYQSRKDHPEYHTEMDCFELNEYIEIAEMLNKYLIPNISHWIVTSESKEIIDGMKNISPGIECEVLFNVKDVLQGGSKLRFRYLTEHNAIKIMISMLSTIKLQFGAKYYLRNMASSWSGNIYWMAKYLDCSPISVKELNEIKVDLKDKYDIFLQYLWTLDDVKNDRICVALNSDAFNEHLFNGKHEVSWPKVLSDAKNKQYSEDYDWKYQYDNNTVNLWNSKVTMCD
eukprot:246007_1